MSLNISNIKHNLNNINISCSVASYWDSALGQYVYFNDDGPVYGPNGEWELDPDNLRCGTAFGPITRPVFSTCKNNCPGGESTVIFLELQISADKLNVSSSAEKI